ncbi:MAG: zinc-binding dehydrogenase, partial [Oscillospiraceae bacterium]|nr:zinc-binding dehydrogenase [Oscillospiraceae bacterium]
MKTKALRLYGKNDLRLEEFELPAITEDEILAEVVTDSICMSSYKAAQQGGDHKRVPDDVENNPIIIGHEFCGIIREVGANWQNKFKVGQKFSIQPATNYKGSLAAPGYSYHNIGGCSTYVVIPAEVMICDCLLDYNGDAFFHGSLSEPMSCIVGGYHAMFHTKAGSYEHEMGIKEGGNLIIMAGAGPMGMGAIDYAVHGDRKPGILVVTDIDDARLERAKSLLSPEDAAKNGVKLVYVNTNNCEDAKQYLMDITDGVGYHDVMLMAPVKPVCELADSVLAYDGCVNFFAGPTNHEFSAMVNFYNIHYNA